MGIQMKYLTSVGLSAIMTMWLVTALITHVSSYAYENMPVNRSTRYQVYAADRCAYLYNNGHSEEWYDCMGVGLK